MSDQSKKDNQENLPSNSKNYSQTDTQNKQKNFHPRTSGKEQEIANQYYQSISESYAKRLIGWGDLKSHPNKQEQSQVNEYEGGVKIKYMQRRTMYIKRH